MAATSQETPSEPLDGTVKDQTPPHSMRPQKRKKKSVYDERLDEAYKVLQNAQKQTQVPQTESQIFGNLVASKLEKFTVETQICVQQDIMNILFKAERGYYNRPQSSFSTFQSIIPAGHQASASQPHIQPEIPIQSPPVHNNNNYQAHLFQNSNKSPQFSQFMNSASQSHFYGSSSSQSTGHTPLNSPHDSEIFQDVDNSHTSETDLTPLPSPHESNQFSARSSMHSQHSFQVSANSQTNFQLSNAILSEFPACIPPPNSEFLRLN